MTLQSSGPIKMSEIKAELGSSSNSLRDYSSAAGKFQPDSMTEFYGYSSAPPPTCYTYYNETGADLNGVSFKNCSGTDVNTTVYDGGSVCAQIMYDSRMTTYNTTCS